LSTVYSQDLPHLEGLLTFSEKQKFNWPIVLHFMHAIYCYGVSLFQAKKWFMHRYFHIGRFFRLTWFVSVCRVADRFDCLTISFKFYFLCDEEHGKTWINENWQRGNWLSWLLLVLILVCGHTDYRNPLKLSNWFILRLYCDIILTVKGFIEPNGMQDYTDLVILWMWLHLNPCYVY
jgi:hypothetical protein